jgi:hypothetical protein
MNMVRSGETKTVVSSTVTCMIAPKELHTKASPMAKDPNRSPGMNTFNLQYSEAGFYLIGDWQYHREMLTVTYFGSLTGLYLTV